MVFSFIQSQGCLKNAHFSTSEIEIHGKYKSTKSGLKPYEYKREYKFRE